MTVAVIQKFMKMPVFNYCFFLFVFFQVPSSKYIFRIESISILKARNHKKTKAKKFDWGLSQPTAIKTGRG